MDSKTSSEEEIGTTLRNYPEDGVGEAKGDKRALEKENRRSNSRQGEPAVDLKAEKVCRICHFGGEPSKELIPIGCDCKGDLGISHRSCAQAWFLHRRNRLCEICGKCANNVNNNNIEGTEMFVIDLNETRMVAATLDGSPQDSRGCKRMICNLIVGCIILAFTVPWFLRG